MPISPPFVASDYRLLVVEDDPVLGSHLQAHLQRLGYAVHWAQDGEQGLAFARGERFSLILLDILLPGLNGLDALRCLRGSHSVPVLLMSALGDEQDRIAGFSQGADDYLPKPFSMAELQVRVEAILRRIAFERHRRAVPASALDLLFDERRQDVCFGKDWIGLTSTEYRLLELLWNHADEAQSKAFLYQQVLHRPYSQHDRSLDMHVSHIRRKLKQAGYLGCQIATVWGKGYVLTRSDE